MLSGLSASAWLSNGCGRQVDPSRNTCFGRTRRTRCARGYRHCRCSAQSAHSGDISSALSQHPSAYTLSLGHMLDLTFDSFAYLRLPLCVAGAAFLMGAVGNLRWSGLRAFLTSALMMVLFFHAARLALVVFDPYLSSRPLANAFLSAPPESSSSIIITTHSRPLFLHQSGPFPSERQVQQFGIWCGRTRRSRSVSERWNLKPCGQAGIDIIW